MLLIFSTLLVSNNSSVLGGSVDGPDNMTIGYLCALFCISTITILLSFIGCWGLVKESKILLGTVKTIGPFFYDSYEMLLGCFSSLA